MLNVFLSHVPNTSRQSFRVAMKMCSPLSCGTGVVVSMRPVWFAFECSSRSLVFVLFPLFLRRKKTGYPVIGTKGSSVAWIRSVMGVFHVMCGLMDFFSCLSFQRIDHAKSSHLPAFAVTMYGSWLTLRRLTLRASPWRIIPLLDLTELLPLPKSRWP